MLIPSLHILPQDAGDCVALWVLSVGALDGRSGGRPQQPVHASGAWRDVPAVLSDSCPGEAGGLTTRPHCARSIPFRQTHICPMTLETDGLGRVELDVWPLLAPPPCQEASMQHF